MYAFLSQSMISGTASLAVARAVHGLRHNTKDDAWLVLFGEAIDVTSFLPIHPGGEESIETYLGQDATEAWAEVLKLLSRPW